MFFLEIQPKAATTTISSRTTTKPTSPQRPKEHPNSKPKPKNNHWLCTLPYALCSCSKPPPKSTSSSSPSSANLAHEIRRIDTYKSQGYSTLSAHGYPEEKKQYNHIFCEAPFGEIGCRCFWMVPPSRGMEVLRRERERGEEWVREGGILGGGEGEVEGKKVGRWTQGIRRLRGVLGRGSSLSGRSRLYQEIERMKLVSEARKLEDARGKEVGFKTNQEEEEERKSRFGKIGEVEIECKDERGSERVMKWIEGDIERRFNIKEKTQNKNENKGEDIVDEIAIEDRIGKRVLKGIENDIEKKTWEWELENKKSENRKAWIMSFDSEKNENRGRDVGEKKRRREAWVMSSGSGGILMGM